LQSNVSKTNLYIRISVSRSAHVLCIYTSLSYIMRGRRGHHRMLVGFTTTCVISTYHH